MKTDKPDKPKPLRRVSKYVADATLNAMAARLKDIKFEFEPEDRAEYYEAAQDNRIKNVSTCRDPSTFRVRMCLGGKLRTIGLTNRGSMAGPTAARFADMARIFFWPYRLRECHEPSLADMNYTVESAQRDLDTNEPARQLLEGIRDHLLSTGALPVVTAGEVRSAKRRTARHEIVELRMGIGELLEQYQAANSGNYEQLRVAFHHILERLDKLESRQTGGAPANKLLES